MLIGWARLTMSVELDMNTARVGYTEMRSGWMKALQKAGHTVKVLTPFSKETDRVWGELKAETYTTREGEWSVKWIKDIEYEPMGDASDCDLLIVENAPVNLMYGCKFTEQPQIRRVVDILNSYKGVVVVEHSDPDLPFPFKKLAFAEKDWEDGNGRLTRKERRVADREDMQLLLPLSQ